MANFQIHQIHLSLGFLSTTEYSPENIDFESLLN